MWKHTDCCSHEPSAARQRVPLIKSKHIWASGGNAVASLKEGRLSNADMSARTSSDWQPNGMGP